MSGCARGAAIVFAIVTIVSAASAQNDESPAVREARERFALGEQHYERGEYAQSLAEFQRVFDLLTEVRHPNAPVVLFNVARCYVQLGRDREAIATYERFLAAAPPGEPSRERAQAELRELRARVSLDGPEGPPAGSGGISPVGPIVAAIGAVAVVAGVITGAMALAANAEATAGCVDDRCPAELAPRADEAHLLANATDGLLFGGLAVAATGALLIILLPGEGAPAASAGCTDRGCGVLVTGRF